MGIENTTKVIMMAITRLFVVPLISKEQLIIPNPKRQYTVAAIATNT